MEFYEKTKMPFTVCKPILVREIFKFEKCVNYANEMIDDVIHSTQYYIICVNRTVLANLQRRSLKLGRLTVL